MAKCLGAVPVSCLMGVVVICLIGTSVSNPFPSGLLDHLSELDQPLSPYVLFPAITEALTSFPDIIDRRQIGSLRQILDGTVPWWYRPRAPALVRRLIRSGQALQFELALILLSVMDVDVLQVEADDLFARLFQQASAGSWTRSYVPQFWAILRRLPVRRLRTGSASKALRYLVELYHKEADVVMMRSVFWEIRIRVSDIELKAVTMSHTALSLPVWIWARLYLEAVADLVQQGSTQDTGFSFGSRLRTITAGTSIFYPEHEFALIMEFAWRSFSYNDLIQTLWNGIFIQSQIRYSPFSSSDTTATLERLNLWLSSAHGTASGHAALIRHLAPSEAESFVMTLLTAHLPVESDAATSSRPVWGSSSEFRGALFFSVLDLDELRSAFDVVRQPSQALGVVLDLATWSRSIQESDSEHIIVRARKSSGLDPSTSPAELALLEFVRILRAPRQRDPRLQILSDMILTAWPALPNPDRFLSRSVRVGYGVRERLLDKLPVDVLDESFAAQAIPLLTVLLQFMQSDKDGDVAALQLQHRITAVIKQLPYGQTDTVTDLYKSVYQCRPPIRRRLPLQCIWNSRTRYQQSPYQP